MGRKKLTHDEQLASLARRLKFHSTVKNGHRIWHGNTHRDGGGQMHSNIENKKTITTVRAACWVKFGPPGPGQVATRTCEEPGCVEHVAWGKRS